MGRGQGECSGRQARQALLEGSGASRGMCGARQASRGSCGGKFFAFVSRKTSLSRAAHADILADDVNVAVDAGLPRHLPLGGRGRHNEVARPERSPPCPGSAVHAAQSRQLGRVHRAPRPLAVSTAVVDPVVAKIDCREPSLRSFCAPQAPPLRLRSTPEVGLAAISGRRMPARSLSGRFCARTLSRLLARFL
jgi:hypothetical protein